MRWGCRRRRRPQGFCNTHVMRCHTSALTPGRLPASFPNWHAMQRSAAQLSALLASRGWTGPPVGAPSLNHCTSPGCGLVCRPPGSENKNCKRNCDCAAGSGSVRKRSQQWRLLARQQRQQQHRSCWEWRTPSTGGSRRGSRCHAVPGCAGCCCCTRAAAAARSIAASLLLHAGAAEAAAGQPAAGGRGGGAEEQAAAEAQVRRGAAQRRLLRQAPTWQGRPDVAERLPCLRTGSVSCWTASSACRSKTRDSVFLLGCSWRGSRQHTSSCSASCRHGSRRRPRWSSARAPQRRAVRARRRQQRPPCSSSGRSWRP